MRDADADARIAGARVAGELVAEAGDTPREGGWIDAGSGLEVEEVSPGREWPEHGDAWGMRAGRDEGGDDKQQPREEAGRDWSSAQFVHPYLRLGTSLRVATCEISQQETRRRTPVWFADMDLTVRTRNEALAW